MDFAQGCRFLSDSEPLDPNLHDLPDRKAAGNLQRHHESEHDPARYCGEHRLIAEKGIRTVINLEESGGEEFLWSQTYDLNYFHIPIGGFSCPTVRQIDSALDIIVNNANSPVLVHCYRGSDRTGLVAAAYRIRFQHWSVRDAVRELRKLGHFPLLYHCDSVLEKYVSSR